MRTSLGAEPVRPRQGLPGALDLSEARQGERLDAGLGGVQRQGVPVPVVGEQVVGVQFAPMKVLLQIGTSGSVPAAPKAISYQFSQSPSA